MLDLVFLNCITRGVNELSVAQPNNEFTKQQFTFFYFTGIKFGLKIDIRKLIILDHICFKTLLAYVAAIERVILSLNAGY